MGIFMFVLAVLPLRGESSVKIWEEPLVIPTYLVGRSSLFPIFYSGRAYQGAKSNNTKLSIMLSVS